MDDDLYDEFGNYIGPDNADGAEIENDISDTLSVGKNFLDNQVSSANLQKQVSQENEMQEVVVDNQIANSSEIVLHEDKQYYPTALERYGPNVETLVQEEDTQPLSEPIVAPIKENIFMYEEKFIPFTTYSLQFMKDLMSCQDNVRNITLAGSIHHGKTSFIDMLISNTHLEMGIGRRLKRYTDNYFLEREREISIKSSPFSTVLESSKGKSYLVHLIDTPGHSNFLDEFACASNMTDGIVIVVDAIEGVTSITEKILKYSLISRKKIALVINKIDRLILELRIPPLDAYYKLIHTIENLNDILIENGATEEYRISPELENVCFASSEHGWCFTLKSFAYLYQAQFSGIDTAEISRWLWGNCYFDISKKKFTRKDGDSSVTFVQFILEPLYKLYSLCLSASSNDLDKNLRKLGIFLKKTQLQQDSKDLLCLVCSKFFGKPTGFVDMISEEFPSPAMNADNLLNSLYTGDINSRIGSAIGKMESTDDTPLVLQVCKLYPSHSNSDFLALARVYSGILRKGLKVKVLGENYHSDDEEDMAQAKVSLLFLPGCRYQIPIDYAPAGNLVLIGGISSSISKTATVVNASLRDDVSILRPVKHLTCSIFKVAVEPLNSSELPKMLDGLRKVNKTYPLLIIKVEESGEHIMIGTGEMYLDCALHDLRKLYSEIDIKISDPTVGFMETILESSAIKCFAQTPNKKNRLTVIAEALDEKLGADIESDTISIEWPETKLAHVLETEYNWDLLAARSVWAFGPNSNCSNVFSNDTIASETDTQLLESVKEYCKQGFQWASREGPLCEEPMRNTQFKLIEVSLASEAIYRGGGQIIPTTRRLCYSAFLTASPRLMEPVYLVEIITPANCLPAIYSLFSRRRGFVIKEKPQPGSIHYTIIAQIPIIDSVGFETDLRTHTLGQVFCQQIFNHWQLVPGDPLDKDVQLRKLEAAPTSALARDFMIKTRRRKGLNEEITARKFFDDEMIAALQKTSTLSLF